MSINANKMNINDNIDEQMPFSIFGIKYKKQIHHDKQNIYKIIILSDSSLILVIDIQRTYTVYKLISSNQTQIIKQGKFESQYADNFQQLFINGKSYIVYLMQDKICLHDIMFDRKVEQMKFRQNKLSYTSIYESEYKYKIIQTNKLTNNKFDNQSIKERTHEYCNKKQQTKIFDSNQQEYSPFVIVYWKVNALYNSGMRQVYYEVRLLRLVQKMKSSYFVDKFNQLYKIKMDYLNEYFNEIKQIGLKQDIKYNKIIKIESGRYLQFTYCFDSLISYQIEGYHIDLILYQANGQIKKKLKINSIYHQLIKQVIPLCKNNEMIVLIKHEQMNIEQVNREQRDQQTRQEQMRQDLNQNQQDIEDKINNQKNQNYQNSQQKEQQYHIIKQPKQINANINQIKLFNLTQQLNYNQIYNKFFTYQTKLDESFQYEQKVDIYSISPDYTLINDIINQFNSNQTNNISNLSIYPNRQIIESLKVHKVFNSVAMKCISNIISNKPNINTNQKYNFSKLQKLSSLQTDYNKLLELNSSIIKQNTSQQIFVNYAFSSNQFESLSNKSKFKQTSLLKISYSKPTLYIKILDQFLQSNFNHHIKSPQIQTQTNQLHNFYPNQLLQQKIYQPLQTNKVDSMISFKNLIIKMLN